MGTFLFAQVSKADMMRMNQYKLSYPLSACCIPRRVPNRREFPHFTPNSKIKIQ